MDQDHVATTQVVASLAPFQFFIEARRKAELAERGIFSAPAFFLAMNLTYEWVHSSFNSIRMVSGSSFHLFASGVLDGPTSLHRRRNVSACDAAKHLQNMRNDICYGFGPTEGYADIDCRRDNTDKEPMEHEAPPGF